MLRPHVVALEIDFAQDIRSELIDVWRRLRAEGHPAPDGAGPPHVSLAAGRGIATPEGADALRAAVQGSLGSAPQALALERVHWFPGEEQVVYLAPADSGELVDWHLALWPVAQRALDEPIDHYAPGSWIPHCTMRAGSGPAVDETVAWLRREVKLPIYAEIDGVTLRVYQNGAMTELWKVKVH